MKNFNSKNIKINSKFLKHFKNTFISILCTFPCFLIVDYCITKINGVRGFSQFFESHPKVGYIHKRNFKGKFGGPLDEFSSLVTLDSFGNRLSSSSGCNRKENFNSIIVGDSVVAGFEVNDDETYISILNKKCIQNFYFINGGVRAHNTHMSMANLKRLINEYNFDKDKLNVFYVLSRNDLIENDDKDIYNSLKSKYGSIYDGEFYKPYRNKFVNSLRIIVGDNFYFLTRFFLIFEEIQRVKNEKLEDNNSLIKSDYNAYMQNACKRVFSIVNDSVIANKGIENIFIGVSPVVSNVDGLKESIYIETCLKNQTRFFENIHVIPFSKTFESILKYNNVDMNTLTFKRDFHLNKKGHKFAAIALEKILLNLKHE